MRALILSFFLLFSLNLNAQTCGTLVSHSVVPNPLNSSMEAFMNLQVYCNEEITLQNYNFSVVGSYISVTAYYCYGWLQVITTTNDSLSLGFLAPGAYTYDVTIYNSSGPASNCTAYSISDQQTGMVTVYPVTTGITDKKDENVFAIYPNPSYGVIQLEDYENIKSISVYSIEGKIIYSDSEINSIIDFSDLVTNGVYYINITNRQDEVITKQLYILK